MPLLRDDMLLRALRLFDATPIRHVADCGRYVTLFAISLFCAIYAFIERHATLMAQLPATRRSRLLLLPLSLPFSPLRRC